MSRSQIQAAMLTFGLCIFAATSSNGAILSPGTAGGLWTALSGVAVDSEPVRVRRGGAVAGRHVAVGRHTAVHRRTTVAHRGRVTVAGRRTTVVGRRHAVVVRHWVRRPYYGRVVAGVTLGTIIAATVVPTAPASDLCWYWTNSSETRGYWDYCQ
jgi:hypothetical protein